MAKVSAGILLYRIVDARYEVLLVHPGGPFFARRDAGVWSIPKGEVEPTEALAAAAVREFREETGFELASKLEALGSVRQAGGKTVHAYAVCGDADVDQLRSNEFEMEWPRGSGQRRTFAEVDRAAWFSLEEAARKLVPAQVEFLERLHSERAGASSSAVAGSDVDPFTGH